MGIMGFAGSGKTYTATATAIGLVSHMRDLKVASSAKPLFFLDTETGSDWVKPRIEKAGVPLYTAKTRCFTDLVDAVKEAELNASMLLVELHHAFLGGTVRELHEGEETHPPAIR